MCSTLIEGYQISKRRRVSNQGDGNKQQRAQKAQGAGPQDLIDVPEPGDDALAGKHSAPGK